MSHDDPDLVPSKADDVREAVWRQRFADHAASGLSVRDRCRQHDIPERQFHRRRLKLLGPRRTAAVPRPALVTERPERRKRPPDAHDRDSPPRSSRPVTVNPPM
jgi:hypothetical protein